MTDRTKGVVTGLVGAALFGASAPIAKLLLPSTGPFALAALFYLGAAAALLVAHRTFGARTHEAALQRADLPLLLAISLVGGVAGPVLLLIGLQRLSAVSASLLLNLEAIFTIGIAVTFFREHVGRGIWLATALILGGAVIIAYRPGELQGSALGCLAIAGACLCWGIDNNLTQRLSVRNPVAIVKWKALVAGSCNLAIALALGQTFPPPPLLAVALVVGVLGYGVSIVLDVYALRWLGAAREAALFATAPFLGALLAMPLFKQFPDGTMGCALLLMGAGAVQLARERHGHEHQHEPLDHDHVHTHDEHHQHAHPDDVDPHEPHSHRHAHTPLTHEHAHVPDLHHRHDHE